jgi:hypothetical protein
LKAKAKKDKGGAGGAEEEDGPEGELEEAEAGQAGTPMGEDMPPEGTASAASESVPAVPAAPLTTQQRIDSLLGPEDARKQLKKIQKLLKQIVELRARPADTLDESQQAKVASESDLLEKMAKMKLIAGDS